eukprot:5100523-Prorocentrum_lima.AAC.1
MMVADGIFTGIRQDIAYPCTDPPMGEKVVFSAYSKRMQGELWSKIVCLNLVCGICRVACIPAALIKYSESGSNGRLVSYQ